MNHFKQLCLGVGALSVALNLFGCSGGVASTSPVQVSQDDVRKSQIFRANQFLDGIEKLPAEQRQIAANLPNSAKDLYYADQNDPATKKRIDALGITVAAPAAPGHGRRP